MALLINNNNLQFYTNKMCNAENRKVGEKKLPDALNEIDELLDEMKEQFDLEYGTPLSIQLNNNRNKFSVGTGNGNNRSNELENGFTDILLSGNTLLNLAVTSEPKKRFYKDMRRYQLSNTTSNNFFKPLTTYTVLFNVDSVELDGDDNIDIRVEYVKYNVHGSLISYVEAPGWYVGKFTTENLNTSINYTSFFILKGSVSQWENSLSETREITISNVIVLEGDYTNNPPREFFKGLQSAGEGVNEHKINIRSINKNILAGTEFKNNNDWIVFRGRVVSGYNGYNGYEIKYNSSDNNNYSDILSQSIYRNTDFYNSILPNTWYTLSFYAKGNNSSTSYIYPSIIDVTTKGYINGEEASLLSDGFFHQKLTSEWKKYTYTFKTKSTLPNNVRDQKLLFRAFKNSDYEISCVLLEQGRKDSNYEPQTKDEINITLNEPLRGIPGGLKDTIEKINGEWKIVRRCDVISLVGNEAWTWTDGANPEDPDFVSLYIVHDESLPFSNLVSDKQRLLTYDEWTKNSVEGIYKGARGLGVVINSSRLSSVTQTAFKEWVKNNPFDVVYERTEPIIEDINPVVLRYWKGGFIDINDKIPAGSTHEVSINKISQITRNIEELTELRKRVVDLENMVETLVLDQSLQYEILKQNINLDKI